MNLPPLELTHPEVARNPYEIYRRYRELGPVHRVPPQTSGGPSRYFLMHHADVARWMPHPVMVRSVRQSIWDETRREIPPEHLACARIFREFVLFKDPPEHTRLRQPINRMLKRVSTPTFRGWAAAEAEALAAKLPAEGLFDLMPGYAVTLVSHLVGTLLGAGDDYTHEEMDEAATFIQMLLANRADPQRMTQACALMTRLEQAITLRMNQPAGSRPEAALLESILAEAQVAGLPAHQTRATAIFLLIAARDNVRSALGNAVLCLLRHPGAWQELRDHPETIPQALEEVLRYEPVVHFMSRHAAAEVEIQGVRIAAGDGVTFGMASANRDPDAYPDPDRFDMHRPAGPTAAFGFGIHRCPGIALARIMIEEGLHALLQRWPALSLAVPPENISWQPSQGFRMMRSLPVQVRRQG